MSLAASSCACTLSPFMATGSAIAGPLKQRLGGGAVPLGALSLEAQMLEKREARAFPGIRSRSGAAKDRRIFGGFCGGNFSASPVLYGCERSTQIEKNAMALSIYP
eukprot:scaffold3058_cov232-Pinguiococcus_pyrenoidosus.AAC.7